MSDSYFSTLPSIQKKKLKNLFFCQTQIDILIRYIHIHFARSFSTSTLLDHSPHPLHPIIHSITQWRKNAHETVSISASPSTVPVFKFKFLYYGSHQKRQICVYYGVFQTSLHMKRKLTLRKRITYHTDRQTDTQTHNMYITRKMVPIARRASSFLAFFSMCLLQIQNIEVKKRRRQKTKDLSTNCTR